MKRGLLILSVAIAVLLSACTNTESQSIASSSSVAASQASSAVTSASSSEITVTQTEELQEPVTLAENAGIELEDVTDMTEGFEAVGLFQNGYAVAVKDGEVGYMNLEGEYQALYSISMDELLLASNGPSPIPSYTGNPQDKLGVVKFLHGKLRCSKDGIVPYYADGKWGYSDVEGNIIVQPAYEYVKPFGNNYGVAYSLKDDGTGSESFNLEMLDKNGNVVATSETSLSDYCNDNYGVYGIYKEFKVEGQSLASRQMQLYNVQGKLLHEGNGDLKMCYEGYRVFNPETSLYDLYDYDGNQLASGIEKEVTNVNKDGWFFYAENEKYGLGNASNPEFVTGLDDCWFNDDGSLSTKTNGVVTVYDSEGNVIETDAVFASQTTSQPTGSELYGNPIVITDAQGQELGQVSTDFSWDSNSAYWTTYKPDKAEQTNGIYALQNGEIKLYRLNFTK